MRIAIKIKPINPFYRSLKILINKLIYRYSAYFLDNKIKRNKIIKSLKKYFSNNLSEIKFNILTQSQIVKFTQEEKQFLNEKFHCRVKTFNNNDFFKQREVFTCCLDNVKFSGSSGTILYKKKPIVEASCNISRLMPYRNIENILSKTKKMKGVYTSIMYYFQKNNYYHWLIENVPRLYGISLIDEQEINFIIPEGTTKKQIKLLRLFLDRRFKFITIKKNEKWKLEKLYFSSFITDNCCGFLPKIYSDFVKKTVIDGFGIKPNAKDLKLYISRNKAVRRIINEDEFYEMLKKYDFKRIFPEDFSQRENTEIFNSASIIISSFGAGFSDLIFSDRCKVLEIFPPTSIKTHYFMLCKALGFEYHYLFGYDQSKNDNFKVDIQEAEKIIKQMI